MKAHWLTLFLVFSASLPALAQTPVKSDAIIFAHPNASGIEFRTQRGTLRVQVYTDSMVNVVFEAGTLPAQPRPWIVQTAWPKVAFTVTEDASRNTVIVTKTPSSSRRG